VSFSLFFPWPFAKPLKREIRPKNAEIERMIGIVLAYNLALEESV
jgi:hypothetical protein